MTDEGDQPRQRVERMSPRRARLTRVPGTLSDSDAEATLANDDAPTDAIDDTPGPNDDRLRQNKPPHW